MTDIVGIISPGNLTADPNSDVQEEGHNQNSLKIGLGCQMTYLW